MAQVDSEETTIVVTMPTNLKSFLSEQKEGVNLFYFSEKVEADVQNPICISGICVYGSDYSMSFNHAESRKTHHNEIAYIYL